MTSLAGKVFAITGGASGMGLATSIRLASLNARAVCIGDFNTSSSDTVTQQIKDLGTTTEIHITNVDVSSASSVSMWYENIIRTFGALDGVVNSAGLPQKVGVRQSPAILEETDDEWKRVMAVNLDGVFYSTRAAVKAMIALPKTDGSRSIVNISSMGGFVHGPDCYAYSVSKRAVIELAPSIAKDIEAFGIRINTICPSATLTPMLGKFFDMEAGQDLPKDFPLISADDIARVGVWLLGADSEKVSGVTVPVGASVP